MLGDIVSLADNLWLVRGDMPADIPNVLVYRVVQHYLSLEFPYFPMALQQVITVSLLELGYEARGPRRRQRFYRRCGAREPVNGTSQAVSVP